MSPLIAFITGLTTGGLSCLAVQGGLLTSVIANQKEREFDKSTQSQNKDLKTFDKMDVLPVFMFLSSKLFIHTIFGFLLGGLGAVLTLSVPVRLFFQGFTAFFMFATAMNLLDVHPIFRYVVFQPPKFIQKRIKNSTKNTALFTPAILGLFTIFIPCGVTQAIEVVAMSSGSAWNGAVLMFAFVLGTSPLFTLIGVATARLSETVQKSFLRFAAYGLIIMALISLNGVLVVLNSPLTLQRMTRPVTYFFSDERLDERLSGGGNTVTPIENGVQRIAIEVLNNGYKPNRLTVKAGIPVELTLSSNNVYSCALSFQLKEFNIATFLKSSDSQKFTFTPTEKGSYAFTCSMGMYSGEIKVI